MKIITKILIAVGVIVAGLIIVKLVTGKTLWSCEKTVMSTFGASPVTLRTGRCIQTSSNGDGTFSTKSECEEKGPCLVPQGFKCPGTGSQCVEDPDGPYKTVPSLEGGDISAYSVCNRDCALTSGTYMLETKEGKKITVTDKFYLGLIRSLSVDSDGFFSDTEIDGNSMGVASNITKQECKNICTNDTRCAGVSSVPSGTGNCRIYSSPISMFNRPESIGNISWFKHNINTPVNIVYNKEEQTIYINDPQNPGYLSSIEHFPKIVPSVDSQSKGWVIKVINTEANPLVEIWFGTLKVRITTDELKPLELADTATQFRLLPGVQYNWTCESVTQ